MDSKKELIEFHCKKCGRRSGAYADSERGKQQLCAWCFKGKY